MHQIILDTGTMVFGAHLTSLRYLLVGVPFVGVVLFSLKRSAAASKPSKKASGDRILTGYVDKDGLPVYLTPEMDYSHGLASEVKPFSQPRSRQ
jgi:hypothetical protein